MTHSKMNLGRLTSVDLKTAWDSEPGGFTPWLCEDENIKLLGDTIGIELEVEAQEKDVGPFRADILCKDTATDHWVLIENQLQRTDHTHLGQLITYAAGLDAVTIVWIAHRFTDEHRAALDWLNEVTAEDINFFGLEVELWQIADSPIAPKFNIVSSPNDWTKQATQVTTAGGGLALSPRKKLQLEFWLAFREYVHTNGAAFKPTKAQPQHWMNFSIGRAGFQLDAIASMWDSETESYETHELRAELQMTDAHSKTYYAQLLAMRPQLENELGEPLQWYNPDDKRVCRLYLRTSADFNDRDRWSEYHAWLKTKLDAMYRVFAPVVKRLDASVTEEREAQP